jgi:CheY-like chemotaxis protein
MRTWRSLKRNTAELHFPEKQKEGGPMPNEKILIVDDGDANLGLLTRWLAPLGYDIELASNGDEAVQRARVGKPDLIILDRMMSVVSGSEARRILKADPVTKNIPMIRVLCRQDRKSDKYAVGLC